VGPAAGLTRDRIDTEVEWAGKTFLISDTGGLSESTLAPDAAGQIGGKVSRQSLAATETADLIVLLVDGAAGSTEEDLALGRRLRRMKIPVILAANKVDNDLVEMKASELWNLGLGPPVFVSALHGRGSGELLDRIVEVLGESAPVERPLERASIAIVGRPNVGKSSLFNRFTGQQRAIVHHEPGTTRDSVDVVCEVDGHLYRFVDTAGLARRAQTKGVEIWSSIRTRAAIERADIAIVVIDAGEGATAQDQKIAREVEKAGVGAILALNKWDLIDDEEAAKSVEASSAKRLQFVDYAPLVRTSAATKRGVDKLTGQIEKVLTARSTRVPTAPLNIIVQEAHQKAPPPRDGNRNVRVLYATQASVGPPTFVLFSTGPIALPWLKFLERRLREEYNFEGNPIRLVVRERAVSAAGRGQRRTKPPVDTVED